MSHEFRTFRFVCRKAAIPVIETLLSAQGFIFEPEPFSLFARRLTFEPFPLGESLAARFGLIYIQDRSSMLPPLLLAPPRGAAVLDMCSAPGSKTSLLSRLVGRDGFVFAAEPSGDRIGTLRANLRRTNSSNVVTAKIEAQKLPLAPESWDYIQLDPPCSGWGTVDKNPKVMELWSEAKTGPLVALQRCLLEKAATLLSPGGTILFSTCTTNIAENEEQVAWALEELGLELEALSPPPGFIFEEPLLTGMDGVLRVAEASKGQGFFLARFRKSEAVHSLNELDQTADHLPGKPLNLKTIEGGETLAVENLPPGEVYLFGNKAFFLHREALERIPAMLRWQGCLLGKVVGKGQNMKFLPDGSAQVLLPSEPAHARCDVLDVETIQPLLQLVSGQSLGFSHGKGPVGLYYRGHPLGWVTRKGKRLMLTTK